MRIETYFIAAAACGLSVLLTFVTSKIAVFCGLVDVPNERSSHRAPTPRGGGIGIVIASTSAFALLGVLDWVPRSLAIALAGGGLAVAAVGLADDRWSLPAGVRLTVHAGAALWALLWMSGSLPQLSVGGYALAALAIVWALNLFNFMDGIDGIAASEAVFMALAGALLALLRGSDGAVPELAMVFGSACFGFLLWNWPPAKVFMGDVGSGFLGFVIAVLALADTQARLPGLLLWAVIGGTFIVDATVTLVRRLLRGERIHQAHRSHAYQWLARRWRSHRLTTLAALAVNLLWLLPCAWILSLYPAHAVGIAAGALAPLVALALLAGSGRPEGESAAHPARSP